MNHVFLPWLTQTGRTLGSWMFFANDRLKSFIKTIPDWSPQSCHWACFLTRTFTLLDLCWSVQFIGHFLFSACRCRFRGLVSSWSQSPAPCNCFSDYVRIKWHAQSTFNFRLVHKEYTIDRESAVNYKTARTAPRASVVFNHRISTRSSLEDVSTTLSQKHIITPFKCFAKRHIILFCLINVREPRDISMFV